MESERFTGRPMECGHCGHTVEEHFPNFESLKGEKCAQCVAEGEEFVCVDFDH